MKCEKCGGEEITAVRSPMPLRGGTYYQLECKGCSHKWRRIRGGRIIDKEKRKRIQEEWVGVEIVPNILEKKRMEDREKIERGECPECSGKLDTKETGRDERSYTYITRCHDGCSFKIEGRRFLK